MNERSALSLSSTLSALLLFASLAACGGGDATDDVPGPVAPIDAAITVEASAVIMGCTTGETQPCSCNPTGSGARTCVAGAFGSCEGCPASQPTLSGGSKCVAGRYRGRFHGSYVPGPAGVCGLFTLFSGEGDGDWVFDLQAEGNGEFYTVGNGCIELHTKDDSSGKESREPLKMALRGSVSCSTGKLLGELRGTYDTVSFCDLGTVVNPYFFKGTISADFNAETNAFENGVYAMKEPPVLLPLGGEPGGKGTWSATVTTEPSVAIPEQECLNGRTFPEQQFKDL